MQSWPMLSKLLPTISQFLFVTHANQNATAVVALCLAFKLLRPMRTVLPTTRIHIAVGNKFGRVVSCPKAEKREIAKQLRDCGAEMTLLLAGIITGIIRGITVL